MSDWLDRLADEMAPPSETPPKGARSLKEIQEHFGWKNPATAYHWTLKCIRAGRLKAIKVNQRKDGSRFSRPVRYFVEVK